MKNLLVAILLVVFTLSVLGCGGSEPKPAGGAGTIPTVGTPGSTPGP